MIAIYKYTINLVSENKISMPADAKILTVQIQNLFPVIWAIVDTDNKLETREFKVFATGQSMLSEQRKRVHYVGTFQIEDFEGHLFEIKK
jgi:hypothetical protein